MDCLKIKGKLFGEVWRDGKLINRLEGHNLITNVGVQNWLDTQFGNATPLTQVNPWYIGLVNNTPSPVYAQADTLASHSGWAEITSELSAARVAWDDADAATRSKGTSTTSSFSVTGSVTVAGLFIASVISGSSGILFSVGSFSTTQDLVNGDTFKAGYQLTVS